MSSSTVTSVTRLIAVPPLAVFLLHRSRQGRTFRASRLILIGVAAVVALLMLTQFQWMYRLERTRSDIKETSFLEVVAPRQHLDFYTETAIAVVARDTILERPLRESALFLFAVNPIPRVLWPGKPVPRTQWEYTLYRWGVDIYEQGGNAMPSIVGQYYLNWGVGGVAFIGLLLGVFVRWIERRLTSGRISYEHLLLGASALTFVFLSFRFLAPGFHYSTLLLAVLLFGLRLRRR